MIRILIAEDDKSLLKLYSLIFHNQDDMKVVALTTNGEDALEKFDMYKNTIDVIISDYRMPQMNGLDLFKEINKRNNHHCKFIIATADISVKDEAVKMGVSGIIIKPFASRELITYIRQICNP